MNPITPFLTPSEDFTITLYLLQKRVFVGESSQMYVSTLIGAFLKAFIPFKNLVKVLRKRFINKVYFARNSNLKWPLQFCIEYIFVFSFTFFKPLQIFLLFLHLMLFVPLSWEIGLAVTFSRILFVFYISICKN